MDSYFEKIKEKGLKLTPRRKAIVELFIDYNTHLTPEKVWNKLHEQFDRCGLPSVYRNLESLVECGVLTRIQKFDSKKHYGLCTALHNYHHHHIICIKCGKVEDINDCTFQKKRNIKGYKVISHYVQINGICMRCLSS